MHRRFGRQKSNGSCHQSGLTSLILQHPKVLSAVAKALVKKSEMSPTNRKNRVGQLVRFSSFSQKVEEAKKTVENSRQPIYSQNFKLTLPGTARHDSHVEDGYDWYGLCWIIISLLPLLQLRTCYLCSQP